jgi:hypothetical protein
MTQSQRLPAAIYATIAGDVRINQWCNGIFQTGAIAINGGVKRSIYCFIQSGGRVADVWFFTTTFAINVRLALSLGTELI